MTATISIAGPGKPGDNITANQVAEKLGNATNATNIAAARVTMDLPLAITGTDDSAADYTALQALVTSVSTRTPTIIQLFGTFDLIDGAARQTVEITGGREIFFVGDGKTTIKNGGFRWSIDRTQTTSGDSLGTAVSTVSGLSAGAKTMPSVLGTTYSMGDWLQISGAIDPKSTSAGGQVGYYGEPMLVVSDTSVAGNGSGTITFASVFRDDVPAVDHGAGDSYYVHNKNHITRCGIKDVNFELTETGSYATKFTDCKGFSMTGCNVTGGDLTLIDSSFEGVIENNTSRSLASTSSTGARVQTCCGDIRVRYNDIQSNGNAVDVSGVNEWGHSKNVIFENNFLHSSNQSEIRVHSYGGAEFKNNIIASDNDYAGQETSALITGPWVTIEGNEIDFSNASSYAMIINADNVTVKKNKIRTTGGGIVFSQGTGNVSTGVTATNNEISGFGGTGALHGLAFTGSGGTAYATNVKAIKNLIYDMASGIWDYDNAISNIITDNTILDCTKTSAYGPTAVEGITGATYYNNNESPYLIATSDGSSLTGLEFPIVTDSTTARTLALTDNRKYIRCSNASAITVTVPPQSSIAWSANAEVIIEQAAAGQVTIAPGSGVTLNSPETLLTAKQNATVTLKRTAEDVWTVGGYLEAS